MFEDIIAKVVMQCFFGSGGLNETIDGLSINKYLSSILRDARTQASDPLVLILGLKVYSFGLSSKYRELTERIRKIKLKVGEVISERRRVLEEKSGSLEKYTDIFEAMYYLRKAKVEAGEQMDED